MLTHVRAECEPTCSRARSNHGLGMGLPEIGWLLRANPADAITAILHDEASCTRVGVPMKFHAAAALGVPVGCANNGWRGIGSDRAVTDGSAELTGRGSWRARAR